MQSVPMYLSEIAPPKLRGALNFMFQLATTSGILIAQLVNYGALAALIKLLLLLIIADTVPPRQLLKPCVQHLHNDV